jgi:hypothetical protein
MDDPLEYTDHIEKLKLWLKDTADIQTATPDNRQWCILDITKPITIQNTAAYFDNSIPNKTYQTEYDKGTLTNIPVAYLQVESDHIHSLGKMFVYRHQGRLKNYRDDAENKSVRIYSALSISLAKLAFLKSLT